jgi:hypothetical protein
MFLLADEFHIKPWEYNADGEVYKEDLSDIIALKYMKNESEKRAREKAENAAKLHMK